MANKARWQVAWLPEALRGRTTLLSRTALGTVATLLLATPGRAQPAANARPTGGVVTAGSASIGSSAGTTTITQSSQRTAINWQSFDVGSQQTVDFVQPSASAVALNRVISPNPSQIAGKIDANGQIILINQSGVMFYQGAQVNTAGLIVSAAGMSNATFMAGKLVFDQAANPNAAVVNQGTLTVRQAGLAALVAPQVANSGVITARLGHVVLAGAKTATLDLYGDGLLALDVNNAVTQAPVGPDGKPVTALVTNTGVIRADGGTVQLTAREADGLVQNLVQAGGTIAANSVGSNTGTVVLGGLGGSIVLSGVVTADGSAPGSTGGQVQADASQGVALAGGARISASGPAGGGTVAIGTTLARATGGPGTASALTANTVRIAQGASIAVDATAKGNGGRVSVLSGLSTSMAGTISARGGPHGGNGGFVETSGQSLGVASTAVVDARARAATGTNGTWLLDPQDIVVQTGGSAALADVATFAANSGTTQTIDPTAINGSGSNVTLQATDSITFSSAISMTKNGVGLTAQAGNNITVNAGITTRGGDILLSANDPGGTQTGTGSITVSAPLATTGGSKTGGTVTLEINGGTGTVGLGANVSIGNAGTLVLSSAGAITQTAGSITAGTLIASTTGTGDVTLGAANQIDASSGITVNSGDLVLVDNTTLTLTGAQSANNLFFEITAAGGTLNVGSGGTTAMLSATAASNPRISVVADRLFAANATSTLTASSGTIELAPFTAGTAVSLEGSTGSLLRIGGTLLGDINTGTVAVGRFTDVLNGSTLATSAGSISVDAAVDLTANATTLGLFATGAISESNTNSITVGTLTGAGASASLTKSGNAIGTLAAFATTGGFALTDSEALTVTGAVTDTGAASTLALTTKTGDLTLAGDVSATNVLDLISAGAISQTGGSISAGTLTGSASTSASLTQATNLVGTLGAFTSTAGFALTDNAALTVKGAVSDTGAATTLVLTTDTGGITLAGNVSATNVLDLVSAGTISQSGGSITAGTLAVTGTGAGDVTLTGLSNNIPVASGISDTGGNVALVDDTMLVLTGNQAAKSLFFEVNAKGGTLQVGSSTVGAALSATAGSGARISLVADRITEGTVASSITATGGTVELAPFTSATAVSLAGSAGSLLLVDTTLLGEISAGTVNVGRFTDVPNAGTLATTAGSLTVDGLVNLTGIASTLGLYAGSAITEPTGTLDVATLTGSAGTSASLTQVFNVIGTLGAFSSGAGLALNTFGALTVNGAVTDSGSGKSVALDAEFGSLTLSSAISAANDTLDLLALGAITQTGGSIQVATLTGSAGSSASLTQATNLVGTLGAFSTTAGFALTNNEALLVNGAVTDSGTGQTVALTTKTGDLTLSSAITATNDTLDLISAGAIVQNGGSIDAVTLTGSAGTSASLTQATNLIGTLAAFSSGAGFALTDNEALLVSGPVSDTGSGQTVALTTETGDINLNGAINAAGDTLDIVSAGSISQNLGSIDVATLTGSAGSFASLEESTNLIGTLGAFSTTAGLILVDNEALLVNGPVTDTSSGTFEILETETGGLTLAGDINVTNDLLGLEAAGSISQSGGSISAADLAVITTATGDVTLTSTSNKIGASNEIIVNSGNAALVDDTSLILSGSYVANNLFFEVNAAGGTLQIGTSSAGATLSATAVSNPRISLVADRITEGGAASPITATGGTVELAPFTSGTAVSLAGIAGSHLLIDTTLLDEIGTGTGTVNVGRFTDVPNAGTLATTAGNITVDGLANLTAIASTLGLYSGGAISEPAGPLDVATLTGSAASTASLTQVFNVIGTLGAFSTDGGLALNTFGALTVNGAVTDSGSGKTVALDAEFGSLTLGSVISAANDTLSLISDGAITQTGGSIQVATLTGSAVTSASLTQAANLVGTLGAFSTSAGFALTDNQALTVNGAVTDTGIGQTVALTTETGDLTLSGAINAANDTLDLISAGAIAQNAGSIDVARLTGSAANSVSLTQPSNLVGTLAAFSSNGGFALTGNGVLLVNGAVTDTGTGDTVVLTNDTGGISLNSVINAPNDTLDIIAAGAISQTGGSIHVATLTGSAGTSASLTQATNLVGTLAAFATGSGFALTDNEALTVTGAVTDTGASSTLALTIETGGLALAGDVSFGATSTFDLIAAGAITQTGGSISAGTLTGSAGTSASLTQATNLVGTLAAFSTSGGFALTSNEALAVTGAVSDSGSGLAVALTTKTGGLTLSSAINAANDTLDLISAGAISQTGGSIHAATLTGSAGTSASLTQAANLVGTLAAFSSGGGFALTSDEALTVNGAVTDTATGKTVALTSETGSLTLSSAISAANDTLDLISGGAITQTGGSIQAATLTGSAGTSASLTQAGNLVGTLAAFSTSGGFALTDNEALSVNGAVTDTGSGQTVALTTETGDLTLSSAISAAGDTLDLSAAGAISQTGGSISAITLTGSAGTSASLTQASNLVGTLAAFSSGGGFALTSDEALTVNGALTDTATGKTVALTSESGNLTLSSVISAANDTLDLISAGAITQTGGSIQVATLTGSAATSASLTQAGNLVGTLAAFSTGSGFALTDHEALTVNGTVTDTGVGQTVALTTTAGNITLSSAINAAGDTLDLVSAGAIAQNGGSIDAVTLTGSAGGAASLTQAGNLVGTLAAFSTGGGFALTDSEALLVNGPVSDSGSGKTVALTTSAGDLTLAGSVNAANDTLDLVSGAAISQTGGAISAGTLTGGAATSASLTQATNLVGTLGAFTTGGGLALTDNEALSVSGTVTDTGTGQTVALTTKAGDITLSGVISAANDTLDLISAGSILQTAGSIVVGTLTGSAATSASLEQVTNLVGTLATFTAGSSFALTDSEALTLSGTVTAPLIVIDTQGDPLTITNGTTIVTGGTAPPTQLSITAAQVPTVDTPGVGAYFTTGTFLQQGSLKVTTPTGGGTSILVVDVPGGQNIGFDPAVGLNFGLLPTATTTWLVLELGAAGSKVSGTVNLKSLTVELPIGSTPSDFSIGLSGTVNGIGGKNAASQAGVIPVHGATLQFNTCPIGTVGCVVLSAALTPVANPLQNLSIGMLTNPNDEADLLLPLVSDEDYLSCLLRKDCH